MVRLSMLLSSLLLGLVAAPAPAQDSVIDPYQILRTAYQQRDAALAASAYAPDAELVYNYGETVERYRGRAEIEKSFAEFFDRIDPDITLDINFRFADGRRQPDAQAENGIYRLRFGDRETSYGTFAVRLDGQGRFASDRSETASLAGFERLAGDVHLASDEERLDRRFYDRLTGRYRLADGCDLVITQSFVRLFARNSCTQQWQGLYRVDGVTWNAGETVLTDTPTERYRFALAGDGHAGPLAITDLGSGSMRTALHTPTTIAREVMFDALDGTRLAGTVYRPVGKPNGRATVLVHGSGPQDRDGYASIIAVTAEALASSGQVVLTFDKRGVGESQGDWSTMGFAALAEDARAAMDFLSQQDGVEYPVGLAGSSQAGWVVAKAIEQGATPGHVHLLGAAGAALTVEEQNLYNTEVRMRCAGIAEPQIALALDQQRAFFDHVRTRDKATQLAERTRAAAVHPELADWLFPTADQIDFEAGNWFTTLELGFDPLPVWESYDGKPVFLFSEFDDSTPTALATERLERLKEFAAILTMDRAQHIGLNAASLCQSGLGDATRFHPLFFRTLEQLGTGRNVDAK